MDGTLAERAHRVLNEDARQQMEDTLAEWTGQGFIAPNWHIVYDPEQDCMRAKFRLAAEHMPYDMTYTEFVTYALGFNDRRRAIMYRTPRAA